MSEALVAWWGNPVTAVLVAGVLWVLVALSAAAVTAVVRLGGIQLGGLLAQREDLLPALPRGVDATVAVVLFASALQGVLVVLFAVAERSRLVSNSFAHFDGTTRSGRDGASPR